MKNGRLVIREFGKELVIGFIVLLADGYILVDHWINHTEIDTYAGFFATTLLAPIAIIGVTLSTAKNKATIIIQERFIKANYFLKRANCIIDLNEPVYYAFYIDIEDGNKYILVSNEKILLNKRTVLNSIDYYSQIPIQYTNKIRNYLPKDNWIMIDLPDG